VSEAIYGVRKRGFWYRPNACGYTSDPNQAGKYTLEEAKQHEAIHGTEDDVTVEKLPINELDALTRENAELRANKSSLLSLIESFNHEVPELRAKVEELKSALEQIGNHWACQYDHANFNRADSTEYRTGVTDGHRCAAEIARAALKGQP
jgi:chromosome segregation ATPase